MYSMPRDPAPTSWQLYGGTCKAHHLWIIPWQAAFTPKSGFDAYENTSTVTPVKNINFLLANNQYLRVNGSNTNLTSLTSTARTITMDNPYDVDWFKIDTTIAAANKYCGTITLTGVPSGDEYSLVAVDANGNVKGSGKKQLGINLVRSSNRYIYVAVYATKYTASSHSASISVAFNNDGLVSNLGLDPKAAMEGYTYDDLLNEQPLLQVSVAGGAGSSGKKVKSLQGIYAALGFSFDTGVIGYYDSAQTFCATRALMAHFGMDWKITKDSDIGSLTWPKLIGLIDQFGTYSAAQKAYWRDYFKNEQQRQIDQYMGWELELKLDASASSNGKISMSASCGSAKQITLSIEKSGKTIWTISKAGASISGESVQPDGTYVVKATAEGKANGKTYTSSMQKTVYVSTPKTSSITVAGTGTSSITLNITNPSGKTLKVYKNSNGSLTELRSISLSAGSTTVTVGDLYSGQKYRFKVFGQNEEDYVDAETQGTGYDEHAFGMDNVDDKPDINVLSNYNMIFSNKNIIWKYISENDYNDFNILLGFQALAYGVSNPPVAAKECLSGNDQLSLSAEELEMIYRYDPWGAKLYLTYKNNNNLTNEVFRLLYKKEPKYYSWIDGSWQATNNWTSSGYSEANAALTYSNIPPTLVELVTVGLVTATVVIGLGEIALFVEGVGLFGLRNALTMYSHNTLQSAVNYQKGIYQTGERIATVEELIAMMNKRPNITAEFAQGDALGYLQAVEAEASHMMMEQGVSSILIRQDVATRRTCFHEWLHRYLQLRNGGNMRPGEDDMIEAFLDRFAATLKLK